MAKWTQIVTNGMEADLSVVGDIRMTPATTDRVIGMSYTNANLAQGGHLSINAGGANAGTDGELKLCPDYGSKVVIHPLAEYDTNPTFTDSKQLITKGYADEITENLVEDEAAFSAAAGDIPSTDKLLIFRFDESGQKSIPVEDFWKRYTDVGYANAHDRSMTVDTNGFLTSPTYFSIQRTADLLYLYAIDTYYGWTDGGSRQTLSTITGTADTNIAAWQANRCGHIVGQKATLSKVIAYSTASGVDYEYEVDLWKVGAMDTSEMTTIHPLTLTHIKNWSVTPSNNSRIEPLTYAPSTAVHFDANDRILFTMKRTGGTTGTNGRYYYLSCNVKFKANLN